MELHVRLVDMDQESDRAAPGGGVVICYYNENEPYAAKWLENLIDADLIPKGSVDGRSIREVKATELAVYRQCHFFAGIAGWSLALRLAGWPEERDVWTGSCPCQPFSCAGQRKGKQDERHLWPVWRELIAERKPATIFGEQVTSPLGRQWLAGVRSDLEALGYAVGAADLCATGVGSPHIRQRLYWLGNSDGAGHALGTRITRDDETTCRAAARQAIEQASPWSDFELAHCADGKTRRIESGSFPLANGILKRVGKLRAYGNAIIPQVAAEFIKAFMECEA